MTRLGNRLERLEQDNSGHCTLGEIMDWQDAKQEGLEPPALRAAHPALSALLAQIEMNELAEGHSPLLS